MPRELTERDLRSHTAKVLRALDAGESFIVTRRGVPVGELKPLCSRRVASKATVLTIFRNAPPIEYKRFRADLDAVTDQESDAARVIGTPRCRPTIRGESRPPGPSLSIRGTRSL